MAMTAGVEADELAALKGQLEALQSRVDELGQTAAKGSQVPAGTSLVTVERGSRMEFVAPFAARDRGNANDDGGFTIAITPSADLPAPVAEIALYGYVKGDVIYDHIAIDKLSNQNNHLPDHSDKPSLVLFRQIPPFRSVPALPRGVFSLRRCALRIAY
jgi:hypothetical protein